MQSGQTGVVGRFRQPEYTGENRCIPCTIVNVVIAVVLASLCGGAVAAFGPGGAVGASVAAVVLVLSLLAIWLRGYLVPGTPALTKQYFPDWLLAKFDKGPAGMELETNATTEQDADTDTETDGENPLGEGELDPTEVLDRAGLITECENVDDLCLVDAVREEWEAEMDAVEAADREEVLGQLFQTSPEDLTVQMKGGAIRVRGVGSHPPTWVSEEAMIADVAGDRLLEAHVPEWTDLSMAQRFTIIKGGLRIFVEQCPTCEGGVTLGEDTVESCCRSHEVFAVTCDSCEARILELPKPAE